MTKRYKRLDQVLKGAGVVRFQELDALLEQVGFVSRQSGKGSSHVVYSHPESQRLVVLAPHGRNPMLPDYQVKKAAQAIREVLEK